MLKKFAAVLFLLVGVGGVSAVGPKASADTVVRVTVTIPDSPPPDLCLLRVNVTLFGNHLGTGANTICL